MFMAFKFFSLTLQLCVIRLIYVNSVNRPVKKGKKIDLFESS